MESWQLKQRQSLPLSAKIRLSEFRIQEYYDHFLGQVYVAVSGGLDSTVLLHLARNIQSTIEGIFCDTELEYPENREFVKNLTNIQFIKPKRIFTDIIKTYGYPIISKEQSQFLFEIRTGKSEKLRAMRMGESPYQNRKGKLSKKWRYLINAPFKISHKCCHWLKKEPAYRFEKQSGKVPILGTRAEESSMRTIDYLKYGCNAFDKSRPTSRPLSFWTHNDILEYIKTYNIPYSKLYDMGYDRSGCMFCGFGVHLQKEPNRFQLMQKTHPKQWKYCMDILGLRRVLDYIKVPYENFS